MASAWARRRSLRPRRPRVQEALREVERGERRLIADVDLDRRIGILEAAHHLGEDRGQGIRVALTIPEENQDQARPASQERTKRLSRASRGVCANRRVARRPHQAFHSVRTLPGRREIRAGAVWTNVDDCACALGVSCHIQDGMGRWRELGVPLSVIALLAWATWPPHDLVMLGWYVLLALGAVGVVLSVLLPPEWRERPAPILTGIALTIAALIFVYAAIPWEDWLPREP